MPRTKHDRDLVASSQPYELRRVCTKFGIGIKELRPILLEISGTERPARSRKDIEAELLSRGYKVQYKTFFDPNTGEWIVSDGVNTTSGATEQEAIERLEND